jgi:hypothetical protein
MKIQGAGFRCHYPAARLSIYIDSVVFMRRSLLVIVLVVVAGQALWGADIQAGVAQSVITPPLSPNHPVYLAGFGYNRIATGIHDDLYARCLALEIARQKLVLCSVDLIGLFYEDVLAIRREFAGSTPSPAFLIVAATHTHAGPDTLGLYGPKALQSGTDRGYLEFVEHRIAATAAEAVRHLQPAALELARDDHPLLGLLQGVDRPPIVKDPFLFVMRLVALSTSKTIAAVVNWSDHPEVLSRKNSNITSDYPHWVREYLETRLGGMALFFSGSIGKVSPLGQVSLVDPDSGKIAEDGTWRKAELLGNEIGRLTERALTSARPANIDALSIKHETLFVPLRNPIFRAALAAGVFARRRPLYTGGKLDPATKMRDVPGMGNVECAAGSDIETEVDYIQVRSADVVMAEFLAIPGEIYPELVNGGIARYAGADFPSAPLEPALREHLKSTYQFIFGLGNDEIGYLIPKAEWDEDPPWLLNAPVSWYGEINSVGPDTAGDVLRGLLDLVNR